MKSHLSFVLCLTTAILFLTACTNYYKVVDLSTDKVYYAKDVEREGGAVKFEDSRTGEEVTLPSSKVLEITKEEYRTGRSR